MRKTLKHLIIEVKGSLKSCDACKMAKARAMNMKKKTDTRSEILGERMYIDLTGPLNAFLGGSKYWMQAVDDATRIGFVYFMRTKDKVRDKLGLLIDETRRLEPKS